MNRLHVGLKGVEDLLNQNEFKWGTVFSTNPEILMRNSVKDAYRKVIAKAINVSDAETGYIMVCIDYNQSKVPLKIKSCQGF